MPKNSRLSRADFARMRSFRRLQGRHVSLSFGMLPGRAGSGAACVVSAKTAPRAVERNRIKRRCRSVLQGLMQEAKTPFVAVVYAKKSAAHASFKEIRDDITTLYTQAAGSLA